MLLLATIVGALIVPVGYALSPDSSPERSLAPLGARQATAAIAVAAPMVTHSSSAPATTDLPTVPDAVKLLLVGTSLFAVAAVVRKTH
ncbi:MAG TPA: hypothetical protein VGY57_09685 [Vicinamibacterales bacterium]|nr:hypothetical protein [Vicinamibacterales bacterium]